MPFRFPGSFSRKNSKLFYRTLAVSIKFERKSDENYVVTLSSDEDVSLLYRCQVDAAKFRAFSLSSCTYADFPQYLCEVIASVVNKRSINNASSNTNPPLNNTLSSSDQQFYATILATSSDSADLLVTEKARDRVVQTQKLRLPMVICNDREHKQYLLEVVEGYKVNISLSKY